MATINDVANNPAHKDTNLAQRFIQDSQAFYESIGLVLSMWLRENNIPLEMPPTAQQRSVQAHIDMLCRKLNLEVEHV